MAIPPPPGPAPVCCGRSRYAHPSLEICPDFSWSRIELTHYPTVCVYVCVDVCVIDIVGYIYSWIVRVDMVLMNYTTIHIHTHTPLTLH